VRCYGEQILGTWGGRKTDWEPDRNALGTSIENTYHNSAGGGWI
jgi:hypothetical protein